jgi:ribosomal protein S18 acetylase RimI-like enzyme
MTDPLLHELEWTVVGAWPATESVNLDGWLLRASGGPTHRGNSVATLEAGLGLSLTARIEHAEAWYRERDKPPMFQLGPCVTPSELDAVLASRGYRKEGEAVLALAPPALVLQRTPDGFSTRIESKASEAWLRIAARSSRFAATHDVLLGFLDRLGTRCRFITAYSAPGTPAAICIGISSEGRLGLYAMLTLPEQRRRGAARAVLHALAESAISEGTPELYLLVDATNAPARALYARSGFQDIYHYHYRILDSQS